MTQRDESFPNHLEYHMTHLLLLLLLLLAAVVQHQIQVQGSGYSIAFYEKACERQKHFMLDTWLVEHAWMNPSIIRDPATPEKIVMVWRYVCLGERRSMHLHLHLHLHLPRLLQCELALQTYSGG